MFLILIQLIALLCIPSAVLAGVREWSDWPKQQGFRLLQEAFDLSMSSSSKDGQEKALRKCRQALELYERSDDHRGQANAQSSMGFIYFNLGRLQEALDHDKKALDLFRRTGGEKEEASVLGSLSSVYSTLGQSDRSLICLEKVYAIHKKMGDLENEAVVLRRLGYLYEGNGQFQKALEYHQRALEMENRRGNKKGEYYALGAIGSVYTDMGLHEKALECYVKQREISQSVRRSCRQSGRDCIRDQGHSLSNIAKAYFNLGKNDEALSTFEAANHESHLSGEAYEVLGHIYLEKGQFDRVEVLLKDLLAPDKLAVAPQDFSSDAKFTRGDVVCLERLAARYHWLKRDFDKAKFYYDKLAKGRRHDLMFAGCVGLGRIHESLENYSKAAEMFEKGSKLTEELRSSLLRTNRSNFFEVEIGGFNRAASYKGLSRVQMKSGNFADALRAAEYTKARTFAENLIMSSVGSGFQLPKDVLDEDSRLNRQLASLTKNLRKAYEEENQELIGSLETQVTKVKEEFGVHVELLRRRHPLFASTNYPQPMSLGQESIKDDEWVLAYDVSETGICIWLLNGKKIVQARFRLIEQKELVIVHHEA